MKNALLLPFSFLYGSAVYIRNRLYDLNIFKSREFDVPVISIGNITAGGTGKTPHVEYLVDLLKEKFVVATLSRGYRRKSKGFRLVETNSTVAEAGDEPLQMKKKFPGITVSVCEDRVSGVERLLKPEVAGKPDVILLDDAFQHRRITPGINILLIDYNRPIKDDNLLPAGRLRERAYQMRRADVIIFTKCPAEITPIMRRVMQKDVRLKPYQELYFTTLEYHRLVPLFDAPAINESALRQKKVDILVVTGIASPVLIYKYLESVSGQLEKIAFPDHHAFSQDDVRNIVKKFETMQGANKVIVTTEKDAVRFGEMNDLPEQIKKALYYLPVKVRFLDDEGKSFNKKITGYVGENKSNRELHQRTNKSQS